jgi:hypothetical protein
LHLAYNVPDATRLFHTPFKECEPLRDAPGAGVGAAKTPDEDWKQPPELACFGQRQPALEIG